MTEITDAVARVVTERIQKDVLPLLDAIASSWAGSPLNTEALSPKYIAVRTADWARELATGLRYYATQGAVLAYYTFK